MEVALEEAEKGRYNAWKDPLVGAVVVKNDQILSKSYHKCFDGRHAIINAFDAFSILYLPFSFIYIILDIVLNALVILIIPIATSGIIKYPTNKHIIGANPIPLPIIPFLEINLSFDSFLFSW